jgi:hypothetical protein
MATLLAPSVCFCQAEVEAVVEMFTAEKQDTLLLGGMGGELPDFVLDAIDNIDTKVCCDTFILVPGPELCSWFWDTQLILGILRIHSFNAFCAVVA